MAKITEREAKKLLRRNWLAGIPYEEFKAHPTERATLIEAGRGDFSAIDMTEKKLRNIAGYRGKICAIRDAEGNYTYSLIKCGRK